jgi:molecular chaperone IbpA
MQFFHHRSLNPRICNQIGCRQPLKKRFPPPEAQPLALPYPCYFKEDMAMAASYDHSPLFRSSVGFDRVFNLLENAQRARSTSDWPPYDIVKTDDEAYRISIAVAGFAQDDVEITFQSTLLTVTGKKQDESAEDYLHRGIASRLFEHRFELADHDKVKGADLGNGLLSIELVREIPEALRPRKTSIQSTPASTSAAPAQIEAQKAA